MWISFVLERCHFSIRLCKNNSRRKNSKGRGGRPSISISNGARISETRCDTSEVIIEGFRQGRGRGRIMTANSTVFNVPPDSYNYVVKQCFFPRFRMFGRLIMGCTHFSHNREIENEKRKVRRRQTPFDFACFFIFAHYIRRVLDINYTNFLLHS